MTTVNVCRFTINNWTTEANKVTATEVEGVYRLRAIRDILARQYTEFNIHFPKREGEVVFKVSDLPLVTYEYRDEYQNEHYTAKSGEIVVNNKADSVSGTYAFTMEGGLSVTNGYFSFTK